MLCSLFVCARAARQLVGWALDEVKHAPPAGPLPAGVVFEGANTRAVTAYTWLHLLLAQASHKQSGGRPRPAFKSRAIETPAGVRRRGW